MAVRAVILAAGRGSRLHPHTEKAPKCLTELGDRTLIDRQLATLRHSGIADIVIVTGYRAEMLSLPGTRQVHNPNWQTTNMVESLFCAEAVFGDDLVVGYGDIVYEPRVLATLLATDHDIAVVVDRRWRAYWETRFDDPLSDAESLRMDADHRITDIGAKASNINEIEAQYIGLMRFRGPGVEALKAARRNLDTVKRAWMAERPMKSAFMTDLLMEMIRMGEEVHAVPVDSGWLEIDTVDDYEMAADGRLADFFDLSQSPP